MTQYVTMDRRGEATNEKSPDYWTLLTTLGHRYKSQDFNDWSPDKLFIDGQLAVEKNLAVLAVDYIVSMEKAQQQARIDVQKMTRFQTIL